MQIGARLIQLVLTTTCLVLVNVSGGDGAPLLLTKESKNVSILTLTGASSGPTHVTTKTALIYLPKVVEMDVSRLTAGASEANNVAVPSADRLAKKVRAKRQAYQSTKSKLNLLELLKIKARPQHPGEFTVANQITNFVLNVGEYFGKMFIKKPKKKNPNGDDSTKPTRRPIISLSLFKPRPQYDRRRKRNVDSVQSVANIATKPAGNKFTNLLRKVGGTFAKLFTKRPQAVSSKPRPTGWLLSLFKPKPKSSFRLKREASETETNYYASISAEAFVQSLAAYFRKLLAMLTATATSTSAKPAQPVDVWSNLNATLLTITEVIDTANHITARGLKLITPIYQFGEFVVSSLANYTYPKSKADKPTRLHLASVKNMVVQTLKEKTMEEKADEDITADAENELSELVTSAPALNRHPRHTVLDYLIRIRPQLMELSQMLVKVKGPAKAPVDLNDTIATFINNLVPPKVLKTQFPFSATKPEAN